MCASGGSWLGRYLCSLDANYALAFGGDAWREVVERAERAELSKADWQEVVGRISRYLHNATGALLHLPVAEAMLTYKEKRFVFAIKCFDRCQDSHIL